jgi:N-acetylmuramoyl-L-alanine amidase
MRKVFALVFIFVFIAGCAHGPSRSSRRRKDYNPQDFIEVSDFCRKHNLSLSFDTLDDIVRLTNDEKEMRVLLDSLVGYLNGGIFYLKDSPRYNHGKIFLPKELDEIISSENILSLRQPFEIKTIVIDPGHGGKDPGAISPAGLKEKDINLKVAKLLQDDLEKRGFKVILTRARDVYLTLQERVDVAKKYNADLFVSVHANSNKAKYISGIEVYHLSPSRLNSTERAVSLARTDGEWQDDVPLAARTILWDMMLTKNYALSVEFSHAFYH